MAENITLRQERKLPFYEELRNSGIYGDRNNMKEEDRMELKRLIKQEETFLVKISSPLKTVDDYSEYIKFKKSLFTKIVVRGKHLNALKMQHFKFSITTQIKKLYAEGLNIFPNEICFWEEYINFCKMTKFYSDGSLAYEKMLSFHGDKPKLWIDAVQWELEKTDNPEKAKNLLLSATSKHPDCPSLYIKLFKILLNLANSEQSTDYRLAIAVFENTTNCIFKIDFWATILEITEEYPFTRKLQELLVGHLIDKFLYNELTWHILAQRELKGFSTGELCKGKMDQTSEEDKVSEKDDNMETDSDSKNISDDSNWREKPPPKKHLELCSEVYQSGLKLVNTERMWTYYIDAMLEINKDTSTEKLLKWKLLENAFRGALVAKLLPENHFRAYIDILRESGATDNEILEVIKQGPLLYPHSAMPWEIYMSHYIIQNQEKDVNEVFRRACAELKNENQTYYLWRIILQYYQTLPEKYDYVYQIYSEASNHTSEKFLPFRVLYLEFCILNKPEEVRSLYEKLSQLTPPYLDLHRKMASFESVSLNPNITNWRKCHENSVKSFGQDRIDVWIDYMNFEKDYGDPRKISDIYREAKGTIKDKERFIKEYNILNAMGRFDLTTD